MHNPTDACEKATLLVPPPTCKCHAAAAPAPAPSSSSLPTKRSHGWTLFLSGLGTLALFVLLTMENRLLNRWCSLEGSQKEEGQGVSGMMASAVGLLHQQPIIPTHQYNTSSSAAVAASLSSSLPYYDIIVFIPLVADRAQEERDIIRNQFKKNQALSQASTLLLFVVSDEENVRQHVQEEEALHQDFIHVACQDAQYDVVAEDDALSCKVLLAIRYLWEHYRFKYLARVPNDAYFRHDYFWSDIHPTLPQDEPLYIGRFRSGGEVVEEPIKEVLGMTQYPSYALGMGYLLTYDVAEYIARASKILPFHTGFPEDAIVAVWLVGTRTKRINLPEHFHDANGRGANAKPCNEKTAVVHYMTDDLWKRIGENGIPSC